MCQETSSTCIETCRCPDGKVLENGQCIDPADCGCTFSFNGMYVPVSGILLFIVTVQMRHIYLCLLMGCLGRWGLFRCLRIIMVL